MATGNLCSEADCAEPVRGRGLCNRHYHFRRRHGTLPPLVFKTGCDIEGCDRPHEAHGLCRRHYQRLKKTGTTDEPQRYATDAERFWSKVDQRGPDECWPWLGNVVATYGHFWLQGRSIVAHRAAYEFSHGPIPEGLHIDHLCHSRSNGCPSGQCLHRLCQNPAHLEAVTQQENNYRAGQIQNEEVRRKRSAAGKLGAIARWGSADGQA